MKRIIIFLLLFATPLSAAYDHHAPHMRSEASSTEQLLEKFTGSVTPLIIYAAQLVVPWLFYQETMSPAQSTDLFSENSEVIDELGADDILCQSKNKVVYSQQLYSPIPEPPRKLAPDPQILIKQQQQRTAHVNFSTQQAWLDENISEWCSGTTDRLSAYQDGLKNNWICSQKNYALSAQAEAKLQAYGYSTKSFTTHYGNALQQELHSETITGVEAVTILDDRATDTYGHDMCYESLRMFDGACQANSMGDVYSTVCLVDLGKSLVRLLAGRLQLVDADILNDASFNFCKGFIQQVPRTLQSLGHMVIHPLESLKNIGTALVHIGSELRKYVPAPPVGMAAYDCEEYAERCNAAAQQWAEAHKTLIKAWHETPADIACQTVGAFTADCIVSHCCFSLVGKAAPLAVQEVASGLTRVSTELALLDPAAPGFLLINSIQEAEVLSQAAQVYAVQETVLQKGLQALEGANPGCTKKLVKLMQDCSHIPAVSEQVICTIEQAAHPSSLAKAICLSEKLEHACNVVLSGEELIGYSCPIAENSPIVFDYLSDTKAFHFCNQPAPSIKNMKAFESSRNNTLVNFQKSLIHKRDVAQQAGKVFEIHFSSTIEREWVEWLAQEQIAHDFVHKIKLDNFLKRIISQEEWGELYELIDAFLIEDPASKQLIKTKVDLEHIFLPEIKWLSNGTSKRTGLHHDCTGFMESAGILVALPAEVETASGFYVKGIIGDAKVKPTSLFPKTWSRKEVLEKVAMAMKNQDYTWKLMPNKKYVTNILLEDVEIRICYNPINRKIETIFPYLEELFKGKN